MTIPLVDQHRRPLPGCVAVLSAEELPNTNAVVSTWPAVLANHSHDLDSGQPAAARWPADLLPCCLAMQRMSSGDAGAGRCQA